MILINLENGLIKCIGTWDRMSSSGQETLDKIADKLGLETSEDVETGYNQELKKDPTWIWKVYSEVLRIG